MLSLLILSFFCGAYWWDGEMKKIENIDKKEQFIDKQKDDKESSNNIEVIKTKNDSGIEKAEFDYLPKALNGKIIRHKHFVLSYVEKHEQAEWVAYELTKEEVKTKVADREDERFEPDPLVPTGSATYQDYSGSGYDRGHLAPAGDMRFSQEAMNECFYMSNISPQDKNFNKEIWRLLEEQVRSFAVKYGRIYVVTGGVLENGLKKIGKQNKISVPKYYYKVLLDYQEPEIKAIAFLMQNKNDVLPLTRYVVSIDALEEMTGIDFFPALPDDLEKKLESEMQTELWKFERWNFKK
ncbi:MAG: DNA/RNA non-specific endonuclease [Flammeovirgaceae bacterium]